MSKIPKLKSCQSSKAFKVSQPQSFSASKLLRSKILSSFFCLSMTVCVPSSLTTSILLAYSYFFYYCCNFVFFKLSDFTLKINFSINIFLNVDVMFCYVFTSGNMVEINELTDLAGLGSVTMVYAKDFGTTKAPGCCVKAPPFCVKLSQAHSISWSLCTIGESPGPLSCARSLAQTTDTPP